jgi:hypothetical protein
MKKGSIEKGEEVTREPMSDADIYNSLQTSPKRTLSDDFLGLPKLRSQTR